MTTGATGQLGLALPVQGELSGTWGNTVNNGITEYTNIAIAGTLTLTGDGAVTLQNTTGDASASNITSSLTGAGTVTAQFAIVKIAGTLTTTKVVTFGSAGSAPYSKTFTVVNAATGGAVTFKAYGQTGVSIAVGESAFVYYNGTDIVKLTSTSSGAAGGSTTQVQYNSSGSLAGSANMTFDGTKLTVGNILDSGLTASKPVFTDASKNLVSTGTLGTDQGGTNLTSFTSGGALYATSTSVLTTGTLPVASGGTGLSSTPANGALDIGNGTGFTRTTLTQGSGITITNGAGSITIASTGSGGTSLGLVRAISVNCILC